MSKKPWLARLGDAVLTLLLLAVLGGIAAAVIVAWFAFVGFILVAIIKLGNWAHLFVGLVGIL